MGIFFCDFETRSACDLTVAGVYNYAQDASTDVLCMAYAYDDEPVQLWLPGQPFPIIGDRQVRAHNAAFERLIFWYVLQQNIPLEQFYCTAAQARANCAPGSLEDAGRFAGASMKKDHRGKLLVRKCCHPPYDTKLLPELYEYCLQDVRAMRDLSKSLRPLSDTELADYHVNERINDRGVLVDLELCQAAVKYAAAELEEIQAIVAEITQGEITSVRSPKMREWVLARVDDETKKLMWNGERYSIDKAVRANLLNYERLDPDVKEVIQCADDLWASSVAKFSRLASLADVEDRRVRGAFVFAGGSATGRASSYGAQVHNFTRKTAKDPEAVRQSMVRGHEIVPLHGKRITDVLRGMLRPALLPAKHFIVADWNAIEGRVNPWLSNCPAGEIKLEVFRSGLDPYKVNAMATFGVAYDEVTGDQRQCGKVQELALGFLGGAGSFATFGRVYGVKVDNVERAIRLWRRANPWAIKHGQDLEEAYTSALRHKGHEFHAGRVVYMFDGRHLWYMLPSGRVLCYPFARLESDGVSYAKAAWKPAADATEWPRARLWRGLAVENVTQAVANDLLRHSMRELDRMGLKVVLTIHDEIVLDCSTERAEDEQDVLVRVMCSPPDWAVGLPLSAESKIMSRYGK